MEVSMNIFQFKTCFFSICIVDGAMNKEMHFIFYLLDAIWVVMGYISMTTPLNFKRVGTYSTSF
jgi:hypothetical protein